MEVEQGREIPTAEGITVAARDIQPGERFYAFAGAKVNRLVLSVRPSRYEGCVTIVYREHGADLDGDYDANCPLRLTP